MDLKQALAVSLIAVVAASLVLLIARALDLQTASRLEPQLAQIAEELQTVRHLLAQGRPSVGAGSPTLADPPASSVGQTTSQGSLGSLVAGADGSAANSPASPNLPSQGVQETLVVWYFHGTMRCPTCQSIERLAHEIVQTDFAQELASGRLVWKTANYEKPIYSALAQKMQVRMPVVVLARMQGDQLRESKPLEEVWGLVRDRSRFRDFLQKEVRQMLARCGQPPIVAASPGQRNGSEPSSPSGEPTLAPRNLLRLNPPEPSTDPSPGSDEPESSKLPSENIPLPRSQELPLP